MRTVADKWAKFEASAIPPTIDPAEHHRMRLAFYAGANGMLGIFYECSKPDISDAAGAAILDGLLQECVAFAAAKGRT